MRTRRVLIAVTALIACLAIGSATVATAKIKKKKITTTITLGITTTSPSGPYDPGSATYSGQVKAKGPAGCKEGRTVSIFRGASQVDGSVATGSGGFYSLRVPSAAAPGTYTAIVAKRVITKKKKGKKFICKAATSAPVVVP